MQIFTSNMQPSSGYIVAKEESNDQNRCWLIPCAHIGTAEMYFPLIIEAKGADVAIAVQHMLILVITALKPASHSRSLMFAGCVRFRSQERGSNNVLRCSAVKVFSRHAVQ